MPLTVDPAALTAAASTLAGYESNLAGVTSGASGLITAVAPAATDSASVAQAGLFSTFGTQLVAALALGQEYAYEF